MKKEFLKKELSEFILFTKQHTRIGLFLYSGKDKETGCFLSVIPSLQISGYGNTIEEADDMVNSSLVEYIKELQKLSVKERTIELMRTGWKKAVHKNKEFRPYVDSEGILRDFEFDGDVKKRNLTEELTAA